MTPEINNEEIQKKKHLQYVLKYQKTHPDVISAKMKKYYENKKNNNPEAYTNMLLKKKEQYNFKKSLKNIV